MAVHERQTDQAQPYDIAMASILLLETGEPDALALWSATTLGSSPAQCRRRFGLPPLHLELEAK